MKKSVMFQRVGILALNATLMSTVAGGADAKRPIKVFILSGQSNMEGKAAAYTLDAVIKDPKLSPKFQHLKKNGKWIVRDDVFVTFLENKVRGGSALHGALTVGFGSEKMVRDENNKKVPHPGIGPELGIGHVLGNHFEEPVLLIKAAWGGRAVKYSFRPPGAMPGDDVIREQVAAIAAKRQAAIERAERAKAAGKRVKQPPSPRSFEEHKEGYGSDYRKILSETKRVLNDIAKYVPGNDKSAGYEIAGFIWFQGWNDGVGSGNPDYTEQMAHFIRDLRRDLNSPKLPFVIGELGTDGPEASGWIATFRNQQAAITAREEFQGNVKLAKTAHCWPTVPDMSERWTEFRKLAKANEQKAKDDPTRIDPGQFFQANWARKYQAQLSYTSDRRYHYLGSGACYYEMGESMGQAMVELLTK